MIISASANFLLAIIALSIIARASHLLYISSIYFCKVFSFIPVLRSIPPDGFFSSTSAVVYKVQTWALSEGFALLITVVQVSANFINPCLIATLPHSASLSSRIYEIFVTCCPCMSSKFPERIYGNIVVITVWSSLSIWLSGITADFICCIT